jgi:1,4-dihydroxy-2-naphthoyl-CoA synthase
LLLSLLLLVPPPLLLLLGAVMFCCSDLPASVLLCCVACRRLFYRCFGTVDQREGMGAFLEKRQPVFTKNKQPM